MMPCFEKHDWKAVAGVLGILAIAPVIPALGVGAEVVTPCIRKEIVPIRPSPDWEEMNGLAQDPSNLSQLYVACDESPYGDVIGLVDFAGSFGPYAGCSEAKGAAFGNCTGDPADGLCVWDIRCVAPAGGCYIQRRDPNNLTLIKECSLAGWGVAWDGEALWIGVEGDNTAARYLPGDSMDSCPVLVEGSQISLGFAPRDLAWKDGYLWASDHTNQAIEKIDPVSGEILRTWIEPEGLSGSWVPLGLEWGILDGVDVLWCANLETETIYALVADCDDADVCTWDRCVSGVCDFVPNLYGDVNHNTVVNVFDIFCQLDVIAGTDPLPPGCDAPSADIAGLQGVCVSNGAINVFDMFAVLDVIAGVDPCCSPQLTGACCTAGICTDGLTHAQCYYGGSLYMGDGTDCGSVTCPQPAPATAPRRITRSIAHQSSLGK